MFEFDRRGENCMEKNELENNNVQVNHNIEQEKNSKVEQGKSSGTAVAALVCGVVSICSCGMLFIPEILGIVLACIAMKDKSRKQTMAKAGLVMSILSGVLFFLLLFVIGLGSEETTTEEGTTQRTTQEVMTEDKTKEETRKDDKINDKNDLANYYGKNVSLLEENMGISLEVDGKSYYSGTFYLDTDEDNNIVGISMIYNPIIDETVTFAGITMQDSIEDAASKLEANGYTLDEEDSIAAQVYKNQSGMVVTIMLTAEDEYVLNCMSDSAYAEQQEDDEITGYYITDTAYGDTIATHVFYAYTEDSWGSNMVRVECEITNISEESITFNARDYYKLDNNGVTINVNSTDYDYKEISAGYSFNATLSFTCPENSNTDLSLMTMTADNLEFNLGDKPQNSEEMQEFAGTYNRFNGGNKIIVLDNGDGTYSVQEIVTIGDETITNNYENVTLDENNIFYLNRGAYLWSPDEYTVYSYDTTWDKIDENQTPWVKD